MRLAAALLAFGLMAGCATRPEPAPPGGESLSGRMSVHVAPTSGNEARDMTASFELQGSPERGRLDLSTPLGTVLARARWSPGHVALLTSKGETSFDSLDDLTREVLGESIPVAALFDWLHGRPWSGAPSTPSEPAAFEQLGWVVSLARFGDGLVAARRDRPPAVSVRAKLDRP